MLCETFKNVSLNDKKLKTLLIELLESTVVDHLAMARYGHGTPLPGHCFILVVENKIMNSVFTC